MKGHVPKGPPRFAWLGARWQPTDVRNVSERRSVLPEIRSSVTTHAEILKSYGSAWAKRAGRVGKAILDEAVGAAAEKIGMRYLRVFSVIANEVKDMVADRMAGPKSFDRVEAEEIKSEIGKVLDCMRRLLDGKGAVPTMLWLDDAQWADAETLEFVRKLWNQAQRRRWPLLLAVTHWEREWRELAQARRKGDAGPSLVDFEGQPSVDTLHLANAANDALRDYLAQRLPGLTPEQQRLLVDRAGGNFLTMVENTGELLSEPMWFVGERIDGTLTDDAVAHIVEFETDRERRVEQRFKALEGEVKKLLGWSTQMGSRFLADVVLEFAREKSPQVDPGHVLEKCVDPYAVLGQPSPDTREFRDGRYLRAASDYRAIFLRADTQRLSDLIQRHLVRRIEECWLDTSPVRALQEPTFSRIRVYAHDDRSRTVIRLGDSPPTWRRQSCWLDISEEGRLVLELADRLLAHGASGGDHAVTRAATIARLWLHAGRRRSREASEEAWLSELEAVDWHACPYEPVPAQSMWIFATTLQSTNTRVKDEMCAAAISKWDRRFRAIERSGYERSLLDDFFEELVHCSRWCMATFDITHRACCGLSGFVLKIGNRVPDESKTPILRQAVSHHALLLAEADSRGDLCSGDFSPDELGSMICLRPESRDEWYDARWAVWLRLCAKRELDTHGESLREKIHDAVAAHLAIPSEMRDVQDDLDLSSLVHSCRSHFSQLEFLKLDYALAELVGNSFEVSTELQRAEIAIGLARTLEAACDRETASDWWLKALDNWASACRQGSRWHSSEILSFNSVSSTLARLMIENACMRTDLKAAVPFICGVESTLADAVGSAPSGGIELLDLGLLEVALHALGEALGPCESRDPAFKVLRNEVELVELCEALRLRFKSTGKATP
jgi:hypothetical protein